MKENTKSLDNKKNVRKKYTNPKALVPKRIKNNQSAAKKNDKIHRKPVLENNDVSVVNHIRIVNDISVDDYISKEESASLTQEIKDCLNNHLLNYHLLRLCGLTVEHINALSVEDLDLLLSRTIEIRELVKDYYLPFNLFLIEEQRTSIIGQYNTYWKVLLKRYAENYTIDFKIVSQFAIQSYQEACEIYFGSKNNIAIDLSNIMHVVRISETLLKIKFTMLDKLSKSYVLPLDDFSSLDEILKKADDIDPITTYLHNTRGDNQFGLAKLVPEFSNLRFLELLSLQNRFRQLVNTFTLQVKDVISLEPGVLKDILNNNQIVFLKDRINFLHIILLPEPLRSNVINGEQDVVSLFKNHDITFAQLSNLNPSLLEDSKIIEEPTNQNSPLQSINQLNFFHKDKASPNPKRIENSISEASKKQLDPISDKDSSKDESTKVSGSAHRLFKEDNAKSNVFLNGIIQKLGELANKSSQDKNLLTTSKLF